MKCFFRFTKRKRFPQARICQFEIAKLSPEAKAKFPSERVKVSTNHGLAFASHGKAFANAGRLTSRIQASALIDRFGIRDSTFAPHADARTAAYGHFGREPDADGGFSWEKTDLVAKLKDLAS